MEIEYAGIQVARSWRRDARSGSRGVACQSRRYAEADQTMLKVETDKAVVEIPSPVAGRVAEIRVQDGQVAKVGDVLIVFESTNLLRMEEVQLPRRASRLHQRPYNQQACPLQLRSSQAPATRAGDLAAPAVRKWLSNSRYILRRWTLLHLPMVAFLSRTCQSYVENKNIHLYLSASSPVLVQRRKLEEPALLKLHYSSLGKIDIPVDSTSSR